MSLDRVSMLIVRGYVLLSLALSVGCGSERAGEDGASAATDSAQDFSAGGGGGGGRATSSSAGGASDPTTSAGGATASSGDLSAGSPGQADDDVIEGSGGAAVTTTALAGATSGGATDGSAPSGGAPGDAASSGGASTASGGASTAVGGAPTVGDFVCAADAGFQPTEALVHPGALHKQSDMDRMRYMVEAGIEPWASSFSVLSSNSRASYNYSVQGDPSFTLVHREGEHRAEWESDATAVYLNALMWIVTRDTRHADKCVEIFNAWKNITEVTGGGTEALNAGLFAWKMVEAAEIIKSTYDGWSGTDRQAFADMLVYPGYSNTQVPASLNANNGSFYWRIYRGDPGRHGNQDLIAWRAMISMGVFLDNRVMFERALRYFKGDSHRDDDLAYPSGPPPAGNQIDDNQYFTTFQVGGSQGTVPDYGYNGVLEHYVWENGQNQESSRDQQHAFFGLGIVAGIAEVAWNQGDDVYNSLDYRVLEGFEFAGRYNSSYLESYPDQSQPWEPGGDAFIQRLDRTGRWFSKSINPHFESDFDGVSRGDFPGKRPVFEQPLAHFKTRMGLSDDETLWTTRARDLAIERAGYEGVGFNLDHPGWGALTFRRSELCAGDPIGGFDADGLPVFGVHVVPGGIQAEDYDYFPASGEGHTYHDLSPGNSGGLYRDDDVDVGCVADSEFGLIGLEASEWTTYTVYVPRDGDYDVSVRYSAVGDAALRMAFGGVDATGGVALADTAGTLSTQSLGTVALEAGVQALRVFVEAAPDSMALDSISIGVE